MCYEFPFKQKMECQYGTIHLNGVSVARKFDEPHRRVFAYTSRLALAGTELTFQLNAWFIMTERTNEKLALLQTFYRIHRDWTSNSATASTSLKNAAYFQDFILMHKSEEMRTKLLCFQSSVLEKLGAPHKSSRRS